MEDVHDRRNAEADDEELGRHALFGPSGAAVWSSPTLDVARRTVYVGTGDSYTQPAAPTSDAIMALDLDSGAIKWVSQLTSGDAWNLACGGVDPANCPASNGPDVTSDRRRCS